MKINHLFKLVLLLFALSSVVACSSTSEEAETSEVAADSGETGIDATTRRTQELEEAAAARAAAAEERMRRSALATRVFYFDFDISDFRPADRDVLNFHAQDLAANSSRRVRLEGHADERGTREYNLALGERRTNSILNYLIVNGVARNQIETVSYGEERPADRGTSETAYQRNRRVEIVTP
ncbi:MAG: peptidoglycan-associated lipoprotein Pal [Pseudomonadales bacterium]|nr:peptidoglycan-associated lipoprotein Pal [Pseudomonadales bacterium]